LKKIKRWKRRRRIALILLDSLVNIDSNVQLLDQWFDCRGDRVQWVSIWKNKKMMKDKNACLFLYEEAHMFERL